MDRRHALASGRELSGLVTGAVAVADVSGFTPLTEALERELGQRRGAEELTRHLNDIYGALIGEVHRYRGSVLGFSGDAITCWFADDDGLQAVSCGLHLHAVMERFQDVALPSGVPLTLSIKVAVASGRARRMLVGDPNVQVLDVLAGALLERMSRAEKLAERGQLVVSAEVAREHSATARSSATGPLPLAAWTLCPTLPSSRP